jgi:hypothetical protein
LAREPTQWLAVAERVIGQTDDDLTILVDGNSDVDLSTAVVSKLDAARPAVGRGCRQRLDERFGGEERSRVVPADA